MSQIVYLARSAAALSATLALGYGHLPTLSATAPARLQRPAARAAATPGLPTTGADLLPEALIGIGVVAVGAGLRVTASSGRR